MTTHGQTATTTKVTGNGGGTTCPNCGRQNGPEMRFCGNCGTRLAPELPTSEQATSVPPVLPPSVLAAPQLGTSVANVAASQPPLSPPVVPVTAPAVEVATSDVPDDPILRTRERERLLTLANVQRMRGQKKEARATLEQATRMGLEPREAAPTYELIGDLCVGDGDLETARSMFRKAYEADPNRVSAERKFAQITLQLANVQSAKSLTSVALAGGDVKGLIMTQGQADVAERKSPAIAFLLSSVVPGLGQAYNGQRNKGMIFFILAGASFLLLFTLVDMDSFVRSLTGLITGRQRIRGESVIFSPLPYVFLLLLSGTWVYAVIDAATTASKGVVPDSKRAKVDKTGWEV